jgi:DNA-binding Xre family transcriptional regulator
MLFTFNIIIIIIIKVFTKINLTMARKDLIPIRTTEEAKTLGRLGGIQSGVARREKRDLRRCLEIGLEFLTKKTVSELELIGNKREAEIVAKIGVAAYSILKIAVSEKANEQTRLNAWEAICDRLEGKPITKNIIEQNDDQKFSVLKIVSGEKVIELK